MPKYLSIIAVLVLASTSLALPAADEHHAADQTAAPAAAGDTHRLHGVVNSVNAAAGRVNITHDPVESLKWPKMKMNFKVADPGLLEGLKPGSEVDFDLQKTGEGYQITKIAPVSK